MSNVCIIELNKVVIEGINLKKIKRISAKQQVLSSLRKSIFNGQIQKNQEITQEEVASILGVSRMPVREAFEVLAREGLIQIDDNRRVTVIGLSIADIKDHYTIRSFLEGLAAAKACEHPEFFDELQQIHKQIIESANKDEKHLYVELNEEFHKTIWKASKSARLQAILSDLWNGLQPQFPEFVSGQIKKSVEEHDEILKSILNQDQNIARKHTERHVNRTMDDFLISFDQHSKDGDLNLED